MADIRMISQSRWIDGTERFLVTEAIGQAATYDCENGLIHSREGKEIEATPERLESIAKWIEANPVLPTELTPVEILNLLTDAEEDAIQANARKLSRELFSAITPVPYERFEAGMRAIQQAGILSAERLAEILACKAVD